MKKATYFLVALVFALIVLTPMSAFATNAVIPEDAVVFNGHSYRVYDLSLSWHDAKSYCEHLGGHLATITSEGEQAFIERLVESGEKRYYWLGGTNDGVEGKWRWITGEEWDYTAWEWWEPDNHSGENNEPQDALCINTDRVYYDIYRGSYKWGDTQGYGDIGTLWSIENSGFICEWNATTTKHIIAVTAAIGGTASGGGSYDYGASATVHARADTGYRFDGWYENGVKISSDAIYTLICTSDRTLEARFVQVPTLGQSSITNNHSSWATPELERAAEINLIPESLRNPSIDYTGPISRAEFAGIAVRTYEILANTTVLPDVNDPFDDTRDIDALKAYNAGIMVGMSSTEFAPNALLNREQCATALTRVFKRSTMTGWSFAADASFPLNYTRPALFADDADISDWAREGVYFMAAHEIIQGMGNNMFVPRAVTSEQQARGYATATREQALIIALRMIENLG